MSQESPDASPEAQAEAVRERMAELADRSRHIAQQFFERQARQASGEEFSLIDMAGISQAFADLSAKLWSDPAKLAEAQTRLWHDGLALWQRLVHGMAEGHIDPMNEADPGDRRFKDAAWNEDLLFAYLKQSYLLTARWLQDVVHDVDSLDPKAREKVEFYTRQFVSALSPSNFAMTNPQVLRRARETGGESLVEGLSHLLDDLERGRGRLQISMTDEAAFEVGRNLATTPGKVVFQNELMQLIQYAPATDTVCKRPLLIVPPWINKFYVLDLQPKNSFIGWAVAQGFTVFVISWVNPRADLAHKSFEDYMLEGPLAALGAIERATGMREVNVLGFCIGGILMAATLAYMAARGDERIKSATFLATMIDLSDVGEVAVFVDERQLARMEDYMARKGYLEAHHMADMFSMMRENDLIWSFVVNNYLMGRDPMPFDLLYWNGDSTRLPAAMLLFYLRHLYMDNALMHPGSMTLDGVPIDVGRVTMPCYFVATKEDHIAPWRSCHAALRAFSGPVRFVLGGSGHIAGVINPPDKGKYCYWTNPAATPDPDDWLAAAERHDGSWWPDWAAWLRRRSGRRVGARQPGDGDLAPLEDAPGSYVRARAAE